MPGALKDKLPNRALSGAELRAISLMEFRAMLVKDHVFASNIAYKQVAITIAAKYVLPWPHVVHDLVSRTKEKILEETLTGPVLLGLAIEEFESMMTRDFIFGNSSAFKSATITLTITLHLAESFTPKDGLIVPGLGVIVPGLLSGEAPIKPPPERASVIGLQREVKLENPNIDRISHGLPIVVQRATPPQPVIQENQLPGEPPTSMLNPPVVENLEYRYDATQFPAPAPPVDTDISQAAAARLGVLMQTGGS